MRQRISVVVLALLLCLFHPSSELYARPSKWRGYSEIGKASHYPGKRHFVHKHKRYRQNQIAYTAAHRTLPFGTKVKVTNLRTGKSVMVVINDRGPFIRGRVIDLSTAAFKQIGDLRKGLLQVKLQAIAA